MMARVQGIDVSHWQGNMNWTTAYNAGNRFTWAKATQASATLDDQFANNLNNAKPAGMLIGFYHFANPSGTADANADGLNDDAVSEANWFWNTAHGGMGTGYLRPMLDMEDSGGLTKAQLSKWTNDFCTRIQQLTGGIDPLIYCNTNYATSFLDLTVISHDLWIANYTSTTYGDPNTNGSPPVGVWGSGNWDFWQYSAGGNGRGAANGAQSTDLDIDVFKGGTANGTDPTNDLQLLKQNFIVGAPKIPTGPSPANSATNVSPLSIVLNWNDSVGATRYDVYLDNMTTPVATNLTQSQYSAGNIAGGPHTWKVVAKQASNDDDTFVSSPVWSFTASSLPLPGVPSGGTPNNVVITTKPIILDWADTPNASTYDVYLGTNVNPTYTNLTSSQSPSINPTDGTRLWRVVAKNATGSTQGPQWTYTMDATPPAATYGAQTPTGGTAFFDFTVSYNDPTTGVDFTSLDSSDIYVTAPNGTTSYAASLISLDANANGATRIATYRIAAPGGAWDAADNGAYTVNQNASQVKDLAGNFSPAGQIIDGSFSVNLAVQFAHMMGSVLHVDFDGTATPITLSHNAGTFSATRGGTTLDFSGVTSILATGTAASDSLQLAGAVPVPLTFDNSAGNDVVTVTSGTYTFANELSSQKNVDVTIAAGASAIFASSQHLDVLTIAGSASMAANGNRALVVHELLMPGATSRLDLSDNDMVIDYAAGETSPIGGFDGSAYTGITGLIASSYNFGSWDGAHGIRTSQADAGSAVGLTTLAIGDAAGTLGIGENDTVMFGGETIDGSSALIKYTYAGDLNFDGLVDAGDYGIVDNYFQFPGTDAYANGDFNYDGLIDAADYGVIDNSFQLQGVPL